MNNTSEISLLFDELKVAVLIPTYNNQNTIEKVINDVKKYTKNIIVVNDGSTDNTAQILSKQKDIELVEYTENKGKGFALRQGFAKALELGFDYVVSIDSDGQHFADDLPKFINKLNDSENKEILIIGARNMEQESVPGKSSFGNKFSNFWFKVETGISLSDTQSGYRLYPVFKYKNTKFFTRKYEFEIEVIVRSAWKGIEITQVPVKVYYSPKEERVSHFRPFKDFSRISVLNTFLVLIAFLYIKPVYFVKYLFTNPLKLIKTELKRHNETPQKTASAAAFGIFMGIIPVWGFQMLIAAFVAHWLKLNKMIVLVFSNISIPPMIPVLVFLSYETGGLFFDNNNILTSKNINKMVDSISNGNFYSTFENLGSQIFQYIVGSVVLAGALALVTWLVVYVATKSIRKNGSSL